MKIDIAKKRGAFIGKINALLQEFGNVPPSIFLKLIYTYTTSIYGSNLWDIFSSDCERLYTSFNVTLRNALKIDNRTHRYLLEPLADSLHLKTLIISRYVSFHRSLIESKKFPVRFLARISEHDQRTVLGRVMSSISSMCNIDISSLTPRLVKEKVKFRVVPDNEEWRPNIARELFKMRDTESYEIPGFSTEEIEEMLRHVCIT